MNYIEAPQEFDPAGATVFLAGGITDAENWQSRLTGLLRPIDVTILNPRRASFPANNPAESRRQIEWEFRHLAKADLAAFWFPPQTLCPIALFELGVCVASRRPLVVGAHPAYGRRFDVEHQLGLCRPQITFARSIEELADQIIASFAVKGPIHESATAC